MRMNRRKTAWELGDVEQLILLEFSKDDNSPDLALSVFEIPPTSDGAVHVDAKIRVASEFWASFKDPKPPVGAEHIDLRGLDGIQRVEKTPGETSFAFSNDAHREAMLPDSPALGRLVASLRATASERRLPVSRDEVKIYIQNHALDAEWVTVAARNAKTQECVKWARKVKH